jgi:hypothetical protein
VEELLEERNWCLLYGRGERSMEDLLTVGIRHYDDDTRTISLDHVSREAAMFVFVGGRASIIRFLHANKDYSFKGTGVQWRGETRRYVEWKLGLSLLPRKKLFNKTKTGTRRIGSHRDDPMTVVGVCALPLVERSLPIQPVSSFSGFGGGMLVSAYTLKFSQLATILGAVG